MFSLRARSSDLLSRTADHKEDCAPLLRVREIYTRTVNLEGAKNGRRYSIVTSEDDFGPRTMLAEALPSLNEGDMLELSLDGVPVGYDPNLPVGAMNNRWNALAAEWQSCLEGDLEILASPANRRAFEELLGLGPGSTPAGDDFLAGYVTGARWLHRPLPSPDFSRTTWLSGEILRDAAHGLVWKRSRDLLSVLASDNASAVTRAAGRILSWGHSSGRAWLAGLSAAVVDMLKSMKGG